MNNMKETETGSDAERPLPEFAVIGGSQGFRFLGEGSQKKLIGECDTPFGPSHPIYLFERPAGSFLFLSRHGEKGYSVAASFVNYRANIYALKDLGVKHILAWSGPGAISTDYKIGQLVIVDDIIDETRRRAGTFYEHGGLGFIRQNPVFCPSVRSMLAGALSDVPNWPAGRMQAFVYQARKQRKAGHTNAPSYPDSSLYAPVPFFGAGVLSHARLKA